MKLLKTTWTLAAFLSVLILSSAFVSGAELTVGTAKGDITPKRSVPLRGQFQLRISQGVATPITANALAIGAREEGRLVDSAIFVSMDVVGIPTDFAALVREKAVQRDSSIDPEKIVLFAIHTHTSVTLHIGAELPKRADLEDYPETIEFTAERTADVIVQAWQSRVDADFSWGIEPVVVGESRRSVYFDGTAKMYGYDNLENFSHFENNYDPDMSSLFFWDKSGRLIGIFINVACTAQVVEGKSVIDADFWHPVREKLYERFGKEIVVVGTCGASGDNSPHPQYRSGALARMRNLRGLDEMEEIARKMDRGVADTYDAVVNDRQSNIPFGHLVETVPLEMRLVTKREYDESKAQCEAYQKEMAAHPEKSPAEVAFMGLRWFGSVVERYEAQQASGEPGTFPAFVHAVRLGDVAVATNQFELFTDYGMRIKRRSPAMATVVVELADGDSSYLPTERAIAGGGYSAVVQSDKVSPAGGQRLVNETLRMINGLWK